MSPTIGIIDYGAGNIRSVANALERLDVPFFISRSISELTKADKYILPGVGEARSAMDSLHDVGLIGFLRSTTKPFLGICLGMQILFDHSTERSTDCLGVVSGEISLLGGADLKVPHIGWNTVRQSSANPLWTGIADSSHFYFVHSYAAPVVGATIGICTYGNDFTAAVQSGSFYGVQFHPEKSGSAGAQVLRNFITLC